MLAKTQWRDPGRVGYNRVSGHTVNEGKKNLEVDA